MKSSKAKQARAKSAGGRTAAAVAVAPVVRRSGAARPWWITAGGIAAALVAALVIYGPALNGPFLLDDTYLPYRLAQYVHAPFLAWIKGLRPLLMASFWVNFHFSGEDTYSYHLFNVLLHVANSVFAWLCVRKLCEWAQVEKRLRETAALFCGALFLVHPLQTESVSYIASRSETLSVFFFLAAYTVFLYRPKPAIAWPRTIAVLALFGAACLSKEHTVVLAGLLLLTDLFWGGSFAAVKRNWRLYVPIAIGTAAGGVFVIRVLQRANTAGFNIKAFTWYQYFFTECRAIWRYVRLFVFPFGQNVDTDFPISRTVLDHGALIGLVALAAVVVVAWIYRKRWPLAAFGVFTALLLLAPTSSFVPILDPVAERRMYLPFIGLLFIVAGLLRHWRISWSTLATALAAIVLVEAALTYHRNLVWSDAAALWSDTVEKSPHKYRPNYQLAYAYYLAGRCADASSQYAKTAVLGKPDDGLQVDWGLAADCAGDRDGALVHLREAAALKPTGHVYSQIGMVLAKQGKYSDALAALDTAQRLDPAFVMTYLYRGNVYALQGDTAHAAADYTRVLALDPENELARQALAQLASGRALRPAAR